MSVPHRTPTCSSRPIQSVPKVWGRLDSTSQRQLAQYLASLIRKVQQDRRQEQCDDRP